MLLVAMTGLLAAAQAVSAAAADVNDIAESYVKLVLEVGLYDPDYVDAYFGPGEWKPDDDQWQEEFPAESLRARADALIERLERIDARLFDGLDEQRHACLKVQLRSVRAKIDLLAGVEMSFDEESKALYGVVSPVRDEAYFQGLLDRLDKRLPGEGSLYMRFNSYRIRFTLARSKLEEILGAVTAECRKRTAAHLTLPPGERFEIEFVANKPWGASVTYQGNGLSLVEVNGQMPFGLADIVKLASHEVYPGHHTYLALLEQHLYRQRGWVEYCIWPLTSPAALVAEGLAEYGRRDLVLAGRDLTEFTRTQLCPLTGLDPNGIEAYFEIMALKDDLDAALIGTARRYLDGKLERDDASAWLARYGLVTPSGADSLLNFVDQYRSYVVTYTLGRDLVKGWIDRQAGLNATDAKRWNAFDTLLTTPQTPASLLGPADSHAPSVKREEQSVEVLRVPNR
jgi:hypothetical protein